MGREQLETIFEIQDSASSALLSSAELICLMCTKVLGDGPSNSNVNGCPPTVPNDDDDEHSNTWTNNENRNCTIFRQLCARLFIHEVNWDDWGFNKEFILPFCHSCTLIANEMDYYINELNAIEYNITRLIEEYRKEIRESTKKLSIARIDSMKLSPHFDQFREQVLNNNPNRHISSKRIEMVTGIPINRNWDELSQTDSDCLSQKIDEFPTECLIPSSIPGNLLSDQCLSVDNDLEMDRDYNNSSSAGVDGQISEESMDDDKKIFKELVQSELSKKPTWSESETGDGACFGYVGVSVPSGDSNLWSCKKCTFSLEEMDLKKAKKALESHIKQVHYSLKVKCPNCPRTFRAETTLQKHKENGACLPQNHILNNLRSKPTKCSSCLVIFQNRSEFRFHKCPGNVQDDNNEMGSEDPTSKNDKPSPGKRKKKEVQNFSCNICNQPLASKASLQRHVERIHNPKSAKEFTCDKCGNHFSSNQSLIEHLRLQHDEGTPLNYLYCSVSNCGKSFVNNHRLKRHEHSHSKSNPNETRMEPEKE